MKLIDIHNHLLPAVDDGSTSVGETLVHLRSFAADGVERVYLTPHLLVHVLDDLRIESVLRAHARSYQRLREELPQHCARALPLDHTPLPALLLGTEILAPRGSDLVRVVERPEVGLGGSDWLLVELGFDAGHDALGVLAAAHAAGRRVILAHPERYRYGLDEDVLGTLSGWRDAGAVLQVNVGSLLGLSGPRAHAIAWEAIDSGVAGLIATDNHGDIRPHRLGDGHVALLRHGGEALSRRLLVDGPHALVPELLPADAECRSA